MGAASVWNLAAESWVLLWGYKMSISFLKMGTFLGPFERAYTK